MEKGLLGPRLHREVTVCRNKVQAFLKRDIIAVYLPLNILKRDTLFNHFSDRAHLGILVNMSNSRSAVWLLMLF